ncbi:immunoglobulin-like domain-containing protein [Alistipes finegoldii]|uniref:immunoglobulin-like domain-containing protein n=1 Tax=Alistipes finegoldii TaxID=214856 RepID=UPI002FDA2F8F
MRLLLLSLLLAAGCTATAQRRPTARELGELQDSVWRRLDILRTTNRGFAACTPERETFDGSTNAARASATKEIASVADAVRASGTDETEGIVRVRLLRADSAMKARFRRYVHDSPLIRLEGFDPDTTPYPPAPEGTPPPDGLSMDAEYAFYPAETDCVRLTIRYRGDSTVYFGTDYTVCRFQNGRWETLPGADAWNSLLIGIGRPQFPAPPATPGRRKSTPTASRPGSRRASIRPYTPVTASAKTFTWKIRAATTCSPPILR